MADNVKILPSVDASAVPIATDDIGGVAYQRLKLDWGADGVAIDVADTSAARLPVGGAALGAIDEAAPAGDATANVGLNGRLQRVAQNLTTLTGRWPAVAALADGVANPSLSAIGSYLMGYNGATWDRLRATAANGLAVDVTRLPALVAGTAVVGRTLQSETTATCSVASGATTGASVDCRGYTPIGIVVPSTFDGTQIKFDVSLDGSTWFRLYDLGDVEMAMTVTASRAYPLWSELAGWNFIRVVTATAQATSATDFLIQLKS